MVDPQCQGDKTGHIAVVGAGALGSVFASALLKAGNTVSLLGRRQSPQITVCTPPCDVDDVQLHVESDPSVIADAEFVLMLVKAYDTEEATRGIAPHLRPLATVVTLQNGLGNVARIRRQLTGGHQVLAGVTSQAARRYSPSLVLRTGVGPTLIGYRNDEERPAAVRLADILVNAGLPAAATGDIDRYIWQKVAVNAAINGLTAVAGVTNGTLRSRSSLWAASVELAHEAASVAAASGYDISDIDDILRDTIAATSENRSSMLQDLEAGRRTEVDAIYGSLIAAGQASGLALPALTVMDALVRSISGRENNGEERE